MFSGGREAGNNGDHTSDDDNYFGVVDPSFEHAFQFSEGAFADRTNLELGELKINNQIKKGAPPQSVDLLLKEAERRGIPPGNASTASGAGCTFWEFIY